MSRSNLTGGRRLHWLSFIKLEKFDPALLATNSGTGNEKAAFPSVSLIMESIATYSIDAQTVFIQRRPKYTVLF